MSTSILFCFLHIQSVSKQLAHFRLVQFIIIILKSKRMTNWTQKEKKRAKVKTRTNKLLQIAENGVIDHRVPCIKIKSFGVFNTKFKACRSPAIILLRTLTLRRTTLDSRVVRRKVNAIWVNNILESRILFTQMALALLSLLQTRADTVIHCWKTILKHFKKKPLNLTF